MRKLKKSTHSATSLLSPCIIFSLLLLVSCGGARLVEEPEIIQIPHPLAMSNDERITVSLYWVIVRNGPGMWVKNADWDEYLINVSNRSDSEIQINSVVVIDSLGARLASDNKLKKLIKKSKQTAKRYHDMNIAMKSGYRPSTLYGAAAAGGAALGGVAIGTASSTTSGMLMSTGPALAVLATVVAVPVLVGAGVYRGHVNKEISEEIENRSTSMPVKISAGESYPLDLFFPLAPSPTAVEIHYTANEIQHSLTIDTTDSLHGLHLPPPGKPEDINEEDGGNTIKRMPSKRR